ncbi:MAG: GSCFA domain-containing protein [Paludibacteraceae bacterium]|nr:GSCFA domain-containing protein [Paludibacteraceae bacterium]
MVKLQTIIDIKPSGWKIGYEDKILLLGSCFSDEMGNEMAHRGFHVTANPFGTLYNPLSIANAVNYQLSIVHSQLPLVEYDGLWHSMAHHGSFSRPTKEETEAAVMASVELMQQALSEATVVIVTFGTAWVYEMNGEIVGNCHKMPESFFTRRRLSVEEIVTAWQPIINSHPGKHWLFTVSPIRHIRDGLHENQLSKATLLMAVERLSSLEGRPGGVTYFPSYEILLDELRDYRFFADDLVHPSSLAVNYIWERFADTFCTPQTCNEMQLQLKRWKQSQHRPLH